MDACTRPRFQPGVLDEGRALSALPVGVFCAVFLEDKLLLIVTCKERKEEMLAIRHRCLEGQHSGLLPCHQA